VAWFLNVPCVLCSLDRLGKTIIFAKNHAHAEFIQERFDANSHREIGGEKGPTVRMVGHHCGVAKPAFQKLLNFQGEKWRA
jgi:type I site-specific restriction endonuclease